MKDKDKKALIKKEQLLNRQRFIGYCRFDHSSTRATFKLDVDERFLLAAEQDGFLKPLLIVEEKIRQQDGSEKIEPVSYYSPFQLFIVAALRENSVLDDGLLWGQIVRGELDFYRKQGSRVMNWGVGMGFNDETKGEVLRITRQLEADKIPFDFDNEIGRAIMDRLPAHAQCLCEPPCAVRGMVV